MAVAMRKLIVACGLLRRKCANILYHIYGWDHMN